jgi:hypothetical protein
VGLITNLFGDDLKVVSMFSVSCSFCSCLFILLTGDSLQDSLLLSSSKLALRYFCSTESLLFFLFDSPVDFKGLYFLLGLAKEELVTGVEFSSLRGFLEGDDLTGEDLSGEDFMGDLLVGDFLELLLLRSEQLFYSQALLI